MIRYIAPVINVPSFVGQDNKYINFSEFYFALRSVDIDSDKIVF